jgi:hypothetical protein
MDETKLLLIFKRLARVLDEIESCVNCPLRLTCNRNEDVNSYTLCDAFTSAIDELKEK